MDPCAIHFFHLLQFLSLAPRDQIIFCADAIPDDASESLTAFDSESKRYDFYWIEKVGGPLNRFYWEYREYKPIFINREENTLSEGDSVLEDIESKMRAMVFYQKNKGAYNYYWGKNQLRNCKEWEELRGLSRKALASLNIESRIPEEPFDQLLFD